VHLASVTPDILEAALRTAWLGKAPARLLPARRPAKSKSSVRPANRRAKLKSQ